MANRIHGNESAFFDVRLSAPNRSKHGIADSRWEYVFGADLHDTWTARLVSREKRPEVQIVCENDPAIGGGKFHNLAVRRPRLTDC